MLVLITIAIFSGLSKVVARTSVCIFFPFSCSVPKWAFKFSYFIAGIVTQYELYTIPVFDIWYEVLVYSLDQVDDVFDALAKWQNDGASDVKSTVATVISLTGITVGLLYSEEANNPAAFAPFYNLTPLAVAVGPVNGTVTSLTQILGNTGSTVSER